MVRLAQEVSISRPFAASAHVDSNLPASVYRRMMDFVVPVSPAPAAPPGTALVVARGRVLRDAGALQYGATAIGQGQLGADDDSPAADDAV